MKEITYSIESLRDMIAMDQNLKFDDTISSMRSYSEDGYIIIIEQPYNNTTSDIIAKLASIKEVEEWIKKLS